jgi:hypothetical protein
MPDNIQPSKKRNYEAFSTSDLAGKLRSSKDWYTWFTEQRKCFSS